jgi:hypothetical protein
MSVPKLEVGDIQATVLRPHPSPYKGEYVVLRINEAAQGREFLRRIIPYVADASNPEEHIYQLPMCTLVSQIP